MEPKQYTPLEVTVRALNNIALKSKSTQGMAMACESLRVLHLKENEASVDKIFGSAQYGLNFPHKSRPKKK